MIDDKIKEFLALSKQMLITVKFNMVFYMVLNLLAITLAIMSILNLIVGTLLYNEGAVAVIINLLNCLSGKDNIKRGV